MSRNSWAGASAVMMAVTAQFWKLLNRNGGANSLATLCLLAQIQMILLLQRLRLSRSRESCRSCVGVQCDSVSNKSCFARLETFFESSTTQHIWMHMESLHMTGTPCHSGIEGMCRLAAKLSGLVFD
jgi:hypothetical protein